LYGLGHLTGEESFAIRGGYMEVQPNGVTVLANTAEHAEEIDVERAEAARRRAEVRLHDRTTREEVDFAQAEAALRRAMTRINVAKLRRRRAGRRVEASQAYELRR
jgi:F-type H+-transporting ATPase subunit epsilon